jgi:sterol desaturase/sphingolipid hydroxylase (fatty acid hydroxylase superfamily)
MLNDSPERGPSNRVRLFETELLERFTVVSLPGFAVLWAILLPAIAVIGWKTAPTWWAIPLIFGGVIVWTVAEYALHRHVFHFETRSPMLEKAVFVIHGNHHSHPNDPLRNLMPPAVSVPAAALIWLVFVWAFGAVGTWLLLGFLMGYVAYDLVHFACHQWPMKGRLANALKVHHMRHHHFKVGGNYAITGMIWDRVFATRISSVRKV